VTSNLSRVDVASQVLDSSSSPVGEMISIIQDFRLKVQYQISKRYRNCSVGPLQTQQGNAPLDPSGHVYALEPNLLFYLVNTSEFNYAGNVTYDDHLVLNSWVYVGNFTHNGATYINATVRLSITKDGFQVPTISSISSDPVLWRMSIDGIVVLEGSYENISVVCKFYDLTFERPEYGVFDISDCATPAETIQLRLAVPIVGLVGVDYDEYRRNMKSSIVDHTQLYPTQVGRIEVSINHL